MERNYDLNTIIKFGEWLFDNNWSEDMKPKDRDAFYNNVSDNLYYQDFSDNVEEITMKNLFKMFLKEKFICIK